MIHVETDACDTSAFGLSKNHIVSAEFILCRAVCSYMWACAELTEQLWGRLQVKDKSSPRGRHQSLMDWHIWEERVRATEGEPGESRQQTHSYAVEFWPCWVGVIAAQPRQAHPSTYESSQPRGGWKDMMQCITGALTINLVIFQKHSSYPVLKHHSANHFLLFGKTCIFIDPLVSYGVLGQRHTDLHDASSIYSNNSNNSSYCTMKMSGIKIHV